MILVSLKIKTNKRFYKKTTIFALLFVKIYFITHFYLT